MEPDEDRHSPSGYSSGDETSQAPVVRSTPDPVTVSIKPSIKWRTPVVSSSPLPTTIAFPLGTPASALSASVAQSDTCLQQPLPEVDIDLLPDESDSQSLFDSSVTPASGPPDASSPFRTPETPTTSTSRRVVAHKSRARARDLHPKPPRPRRRKVPKITEADALQALETVGEFSSARTRSVSGPAAPSVPLATPPQHLALPPPSLTSAESDVSFDVSEDDDYSRRYRFYRQIQDTQRFLHWSKNMKATERTVANGLVPPYPVFTLSEPPTQVITMEDLSVFKQETGLYVCPFCPAKSYLFRQHSSVTISDTYQSALALHIHISTYHYPFLFHLRCPQCHTFHFSLSTFVLHLTTELKSLPDCTVLRDALTSARTGMFDSYVTRRAMSNKHYIPPLCPTYEVPVVSTDRRYVFKFGPYQLHARTFLDNPLNPCYGSTLPNKTWSMPIMTRYFHVSNDNLTHLYCLDDPEKPHPSPRSDRPQLPVTYVTSIRDLSPDARDLIAARRSSSATPSTGRKRPASASPASSSSHPRARPVNAPVVIRQPPSASATAPPSPPGVPCSESWDKEVSENPSPAFCVPFDVRRDPITQELKPVVTNLKIRADMEAHARRVIQESPRAATDPVRPVLDSALTIPLDSRRPLPTPAVPPAPVVPEAPVQPSASIAAEDPFYRIPPVPNHPRFRELSLQLDDTPFAPLQVPDLPQVADYLSVHLDAIRDRTLPALAQPTDAPYHPMAASLQAVMETVWKSLESARASCSDPTRPTAPSENLVVQCKQVLGALSAHDEFVVQFRSRLNHLLLDSSARQSELHGIYAVLENPVLNPEVSSLRRQLAQAEAAQRALSAKLDSERRLTAHYKHLASTTPAAPSPSSEVEIDLGRRLRHFATRLAGARRAVADYRDAFSPAAMSSTAGLFLATVHAQKPADVFESVSSCLASIPGFDFERVDPYLHYAPRDEDDVPVSTAPPSPP